MSTPGHHPPPPADLRAQLERDGYCLLSAALGASQVADLLSRLEPALAARKATRATGDRATVRSRGEVVAARQVIEQCPEVARLWRSPPLVSLLTEVLGPACGLVRALYFDKPPARSWSLPWHRDRAIAVRCHPPVLAPFSKPTLKAGVPHVEATPELLQQMLALRIHLDDADQGNGALQVIAGSHRSAGRDDPAAGPAGTIVPIHARAGDVMAMRPLLSHSSTVSRDGDRRHRRVLHLEFAAREELPVGYAWRDFIAVLPAEC